jgi:nucleotide sugar dehydrogenase
MVAIDNIVDDLRKGKRKIGVWGLGYIGYSTISFYAKNGVKAIGYDVDKNKVTGLNRGEINLPNIEYWLGFDVKPLLASDMIKAVKNWRQMISGDIAVHFVCVPTEKNAMPYDLALQGVIRKIAAYSKIKTNTPPLIIIESTVSVDRVKKVIVQELKKSGLKLWEEILLAVAPRRDWFVSAEKSIVTIPRVVGGVTKKATDLAAEILRIVSHTVLKAPDCYHAALIKSVENTYRQVGITLANQLSLAFPDIDMKEVLRLVGTKWNIDTYHPSFGIGGYCIPLAPQYVINGAKEPNILTIIKESMASSKTMPYRIANAILKSKVKRVGILGLAYKGDLKVDILSPTKDIVAILKKHNINVKVHDPYYTIQEINDRCGVDSFNFPEGMDEFEMILLVSDHSLYRYTPVINITRYINNKCCRYIIDNVGLWKKIKWPKGIRYYEAGCKHWLNFYK